MKKDFLVLTPKSQPYPFRLKQVELLPPRLYFKSKIKDLDKELFRQPALAVVGSRKMTNYGNEIAVKLVSQIAKKGAVIVSGMARGVDSVAHRTALKNKAKTIAVLGSGIDIIYPQESADIYNSIINTGLGAVVSQFPPGTKPEAKNFPARNRIIAALSDAVLVIEAAQRSGTLITARWAAEQGKEVMVVPGPITSPFSQGVNWLIKQGAKPVSTAEEILEELPL